MVKDEPQETPRPPLELPRTLIERDYCDLCTFKPLARSKAAIADALEDHLRWHIHREKGGIE